MRLSRIVKGLLAVLLVLTSTALLLVTLWLFTMILAFFSLWWALLSVAVAAITFLTTLVVASTGHMRHQRDVPDRQRVLTWPFRRFWVTLIGVVFGYVIAVAFIWDGGAGGGIFDSALVMLTVLVLMVLASGGFVSCCGARAVSRQG